LQEGDVVLRQRGSIQFSANVLSSVSTHSNGGAPSMLQGIAQVGAGQQQARLGIGDDRQQALLMMRRADSGG
jgi:hypothetical protein